ncbi:hypothetical protein KDN32_04810 [Nocardioides sp. J2M5]|uniref:hypothetical protein n=1 Tax=Nocardioides palaemonis TaxID=2829810 RepID=UPI001BAC29BE|nr:hypothetical protein [Nocardioides palaemonis]MBS2937062.1 hypothetical protein [Nocardioides palaemonis]
MIDGGPVRRILEQFPPERRPPVVLHLPLEFAKRGFYHGDLVATAIDRDRIVYQVSYEFDGVECDGWFPADWVWRPGTNDDMRMAPVAPVGRAEDT